MVVQHRLHLLGVGHKIRREIPVIELHPLDDIERGLGGSRFFHRDRAFRSDLLHRVRHHFADGGIVMRGNRRDLRLFLPALLTPGAKFVEWRQPRPASRDPTRV